MYVYIHTHTDFFLKYFHGIVPAASKKLELENDQVMARVSGGVCGWSMYCPSPLSCASTAGGWKMFIVSSSLPLTTSGVPLKPFQK